MLAMPEPLFSSYMHMPRRGWLLFYSAAWEHGHAAAGLQLMHCQQLPWQGDSTCALLLDLYG